MRVNKEKSLSLLVAIGGGKYLTRPDLKGRLKAAQRLHLSPLKKRSFQRTRSKFEQHAVRLQSSDSLKVKCHENNF